MMMTCSSLEAPTHLTVLVELAAEGDGQVGRRARAAVAPKEIFAVVEGAASALAYVHVLEARLHTATQREQELRGGAEGVNVQHTCCQVTGCTYCELCGKCSRCVMVTKGWFRVFMGVMRLSASSVSIFFRRSMNSRLSAFSARMSVPSRLVMLTCRQRQTGHVTLKVTLAK